MVLWGHTKGLLGILEEVLLIGGVTATGGSNLVLDCVQHLDIQHLELWTQNEEQRAYRKVSDQVNLSSSLLVPTKITFGLSLLLFSYQSTNESKIERENAHPSFWDKMQS